MLSLIAWTITVIVERVREKAVNRRLANVILWGLDFVFACLCFLVLWNIWDNGRDLINEERPTRTAQDCFDEYLSMSLEEKGWWEGSEDYVNYCSK